MTFFINDVIQFYPTVLCRKFIHQVKLLTVYLAVLYMFICAGYKAVYNLPDSFMWVFFYSMKVVESLSYSFALEFYTASLKVDCLPDSFVCRFIQKVKKLTVYLTVLWPQIPKSDCLVQWSREKWIVDRGHIQGDNSDNTHTQKKIEWNTYMCKCKYNVQNGKYYRCILTC